MSRPAIISTTAEREEILGEITAELGRKGYMVEWLPYERGL